MRVYTLKSFKFHKGNALKVAPVESFIDVPDEQGAALLEAGKVKLANEKNEIIEDGKALKPEPKPKAVEPKADKSKPSAKKEG